MYMCMCVCIYIYTYTHTNIYLCIHKKKIISAINWLRYYGNIFSFRVLIFWIIFPFRVINVYGFFSYITILCIIKSAGDSHFLKKCFIIISRIFTQAADTCSLSFNADTLLMLPKGINKTFQTTSGTHIFSLNNSWMIYWLKHWGIMIILSCHQE